METTLEKSYFKGKDGTKFYYKKDIPKNPKAIIIIVHGFAEHLGRYEYVKDRLYEADFAVYRYDLRGHGRTEGEKGHINYFSEFIEDTNELVNLAHRDLPQKPIYMLGHSMGGLITLSYGLKYKNKLKGQILSGAAAKKVPQVEGIKGGLIQLLNYFTPKMRIKQELSEDICTDKKVVKAYDKDPLVLKDATLNFYVQFLLKGTNFVKNNIQYYNYPCFIVHGEKDKIIPKEASLYIYNNISSKDKEIKIYDGLYHEIMNEVEKDIVIKDIINWIEKRGA